MTSFQAAFDEGLRKRDALAAADPASAVIQRNTPQFGARNGTLESFGVNDQPRNTGERKGPTFNRGGGIEDEAKNALLQRIIGGDRFQAASAARALSALGGGLQNYGENAVRLTGIDEDARQFDMGALMKTLNPVQGESVFNKFADRQGVSRQMGPSVFESLAGYGKQAGATGPAITTPTQAASYNYSYGPSQEQGTATAPGARPTTPGYVSFAPSTPGGDKSKTSFSQFEVEKQAMGGEVMGSGDAIGYAMGGMVGSPSNAMDVAGAGNPVSAITASYPAYLKAMAKSKSKDKPMSLEAYIKAAMAAVSKKMQQRQARGGMPEAGPNPVMGFANGGPVDIGGKLLDGPGHERSDSIPAVVDGNKAAAVSKGEFVVPKHVVEYFGTKHFDSLLEKARMAMRKSKAASGTA